MAKEVKKSKAGNDIPTPAEVIGMYKKEVGTDVDARKAVQYYVDEKSERPMTFQEIIKLFLDCHVMLDETFKKFYEKKNKSVERCQKYVFDQMKKFATNNVAAGSPKQVFGMCIHYYEEDGLDVDKQSDEEVKKSNSSVNVVNAQKEDVTGEFSLFSMI